MAPKNTNDLVFFATNARSHSEALESLRRKALQRKSPVNHCERRTPWELWSTDRCAQPSANTVVKPQLAFMPKTMAFAKESHCPSTFSK